MTGTGSVVYKRSVYYNSAKGKVKIVRFDLMEERVEACKEFPRFSGQNYHALQWGGYNFVKLCADEVIKLLNFLKKPTILNF